MARRIIVLAGALALALALGAGGTAAEEAEEDRPAVAAAPPLYKLPKVGKPTGRIGGGRRGTGGELPSVYALVPDHVGYTTQRQPVLYWFLSQPVEGNLRFELTLIDEDSVAPLVDRAFETPPSPGLNRIRLADHGLELAPGEEYQWSIALVPDRQDRSQDVVSSGWIEVVPAPAALSEQLAAAGPAGAAAVYGEHGLWYDTLAAAIADTERQPGEATSRERLATLLTQAGLPPVPAQ
jgi:hypothetical protein